MPIDYKESINKLNDLLKDSDGEPIDIDLLIETLIDKNICLLYTSPSPRDKRQSRMPSSA